MTICSTTTEDRHHAAAADFWRPSAGIRPDRGVSESGDRQALYPNEGVDGFSAHLPESGLDQARSHDLRHTFVTNARRAKIDYVRIMAITGHKTLRVFQRYNLIDEGDLQEAMTTLQGYLTDHEMDTSMDTNASEAITSRAEERHESTGLSRSAPLG